ncbi:hypothetical protein Tco_0780518 [Tanacetum coccineum]
MLESVVISVQFPCALHNFVQLDDVGSSDWLDMFIFYCRRYAAEDHEFASRINTLCGELTIACQKRIYFVQELETVKSLIAPVTMAEFLNEIQFKDDQRLMQLQNLERETEARAFVKELFVQKLLRNVSF